MDERYDYRMAAAYYRGRAIRKNKPDFAQELLKKPLSMLTDEETEQIVAAGRAADDKLYYFKRTHENMARVRRVLGFLKSVTFDSLLDVGSSRGVFLLPFMAEFPWVQVTSVDILPHRVQFLQDLSAGGITQLTAISADITTQPMPEKSHDIVTMLEVLEHIPDVERAVQAAVKIAGKYIVVSVPGKPDDNPEHIHLLTKEVLTALFEKAGCRKLHFDGVNGHLILIAALVGA